MVLVSAHSSAKSWGRGRGPGFQTEGADFERKNGVKLCFVLFRFTPWSQRELFHSLSGVVGRWALWRPPLSSRPLSRSPSPWSSL